MPVTVCPPVDELMAGLSGSAIGPALSSLERHVESCSTCQDRIRRLAGGQASLDCALREVADVPPSTVDADFQRVVSHILTPPVVERLQPGQMLNDYRLEEMLGEGGMGAVWRARHVRLDMSVALKVMARRLTGDPGAEARFAREMKAVGRLAHPNIVRASDAGEDDGRPYLVMEHLAGLDLGRVVRERGALAVADACDVVRQAALGLHHAHEAGLVHRDVKPSNLFLTQDGTVKLLDLGLARLNLADVAVEVMAGDDSTHDSGLTGASRVLGTRDYMAPEQSRDPRAVDARADVYGLGATLVFLVTGQHPRPGAESDVVARGVPAAILRRMLAPDPLERFPTAAAVAEALAPFARRSIAPALRGHGHKRLWMGIAATAVIATLLVLLRPWSPSIASESGDTASVGPPPGKLPMTEPQAKALQGEWAMHLGRGVRVKNLQDSTMVLIPPGSFGLSTECRVEVTRPYEIASHEITVKQFRAFVEATGYVSEGEKNGKGGFLFDRANYHNMQQRKPEFVWRAPGYARATDEYPVTQVSWNDANAYCAWLSEGESLKYRLPTEAEWKWACRAGSSADYYFGDDKNLLRDHAWTVMNSMDQPQPVGQLKPNAWGLFDMHGNVSEWCADNHGPLPTEPQVDYRGPDKSIYRVIAGGAHTDMKADCHHRQGSGPAVGISFLGFRVVREVR